MKVLFTTLIAIFLFINNSDAATCRSLGNGNWASPATWSCGAVPVTGDTIIIEVGHTVTLSSNINLTGLVSVLIIEGTLLFDTPSAKLFLECGSTLYIAPTGRLVSTGNGTSSHSIKICDSKVWSGSTIPLVGPFTFGIPLPIELAYFSAETNGQNVDLIWKTASESNNDYFTIEGSEDARNWTAMTTVTAVGNSTSLTSYEETVDNRTERFTYFRLKQTDFDGKFSYSGIVAVELGAFESMKIYPNPSNGNELNINLPIDDEFEIQIISTNGQVIYNEVVSGSSLQLRGLDLDRGVYLVRAINESTSITERLIVR